MYRLDVLDPVAEQRGVKNAQRINVRPSSLDNKKLGLVWSGTHGGDVALKRAGEMLQERFQNLEVKFYTGGRYPCPPEILKQAADESDLIIGATAD
jgi:hypothetical protein